MSRSQAIAAHAVVATFLMVCAALPAQREPMPAPSGAPAAVADPSLHDDRHEAYRKAAQAGLAWLAAGQQPSGGWTGIVGHKQNDDYLVLTTVEAQRLRNTAHVGVSALVGIAFLANGHLPDRGPYGAVVRRTVDYVIGCVAENGFVTDSGTRMYSHAFATLFLAQVYGTVPEATVRGALERAVHLIVDSQNALGAWRYNLFSKDADLSVTVCQLQALRAARNVGIQVPKSTIDAAVDYVRRSRVSRGPDRGLFSYKIAGRGAFEKNDQYAINAAALTSLFTAGVHDPEIYEPVLRFLDEQYPRMVRWYGDHYFFWYGSFYAAQAHFQAGGSQFAAYHARIGADLMRMQTDSGRWLGSVGPGDEFATAVACTILAIPQQYLPIFQR
jgi:hypothetical protein